MSGFQDSQIRDRAKSDSAELTDAMLGLVSLLAPGGKGPGGSQSTATRSLNALQEICRFYGVRWDEDAEAQARAVAGESALSTGLPAAAATSPVSAFTLSDSLLDEWLERLLRPSGVMRRSVRPTDKWYKDASGAMLCEVKSGGHVALLPTLRGDRFYDYEQQRTVNVDAKTAELLGGEAICFYRPLPNRTEGLKGIAAFLWARTEKADFLPVVLAIVLAALVGMIVAYANEFLFSRVVPSGQLSELAAVAALLIGASVSLFLISVVKGLAEARISTKLGIVMDSAVFGKLINMPSGFFRSFSSGDLANRVGLLKATPQFLSQAVFTVTLGVVFALVYTLQIITIAPALAGPAAIAIALQFAVGRANVRLAQAVTRKKLPVANKTSALVYSLFAGIQKIRLSGAEKRAFARWARLYREQAAYDYNPPLLLRIMPALNVAAALLGSLLLYGFAAGFGVDVSHYFASMTAFGQAAAALLPVAVILANIASLGPILEVAKPLLQEPAELDTSREIVGRLGGALRIEGISFRYAQDAPWILNDFSLNIRRGEYVALVGKTGCGKSTLVKLLLGFEKPQLGAIYYDEKDIDRIDLRSLRRNLGVVLQTGTLFQESIFSNITISAPGLSLKEAWEAAEMAGVAEDIRAMPMGMRTVVSEGSGGLSGGQRQRIMIARAIASKPGVLIFDEATSALDNIAQRQVSASLASLRSTRIVVAHRLSTIKEADRIVVLDGGSVVEDGSYDELIAQDGLFADLVRRQQLE